MKHRGSRRMAQRGGAVGVAAAPAGSLTAPVSGERLVEFIDYPDGWTTDRGPDKRRYDIRRIDGAPTPIEEFFTTQHHGHPQIDGDAFRLELSGLVQRPGGLSLQALRELGETELHAGFECSGNSAGGMQGSASNARWTGVPLRKVLGHMGVHDAAREVVLFGADRGVEEVEFRGRKYEVEQQYGRSLSIDEAMGPAPFLAFGMNGRPLTVHQGFPLRVIMPGWYGAPNVKWLVGIHLQDAPYLGKYQARWYRTLRAERLGDETKWVETAITRMRLKSVIARVSMEGDTLRVLGFVLSDGTPLRGVEVRIDNGEWREATLEPDQDAYAWKLFSYEWQEASNGEHTIVSRATNIHGTVQPTRAELSKVKKTRLEDNSQHPRRIRIG